MIEVIKKEKFVITRLGYGTGPQSFDRNLKLRKALIENSAKDKHSSISYNLSEPLGQAHGVSFKGSFFKNFIAEFRSLYNGNIVDSLILKGTSPNKLALEGLDLLKEVSNDQKNGVVSKTIDYLSHGNNNREKTVLGDLADNCKSMTYRLGLDTINMTLDVFNHIPGTKGKIGNKMRNNFPLLKDALNNRRDSIVNEANAYGLKGFIGWFEKEYIVLGGDKEKLKESIKETFFKNAGNPNQMNFGAVADRVWARVVSGIPSALFLANDAANLTTILKNDKKESDKEYKSRFVQEAGRVGLSAGLMFFILGGLRKFTTKSMSVNIGITLLATAIAEVVGRKLAGKRILPMTKEQAEKLYGNNKENNTAPLAKPQTTLNKKVGFGGTTEKASQTKENSSVNWFEIGIKGIAGFVSTVAAVSIIGNVFKKSNVSHSAKDLALIFEELKNQLPEKAEKMFSAIKAAPENVMSGGKALDKEALTSLDNFINALKSLGDQKVKVGEVPNRYVDALVNKGFFFPIKLLSTDITGAVHGIGQYVKSRVDNAFVSFASQEVKQKDIVKVLEKNTDKFIAELKEQLGSKADDAVSKILGNGEKDLSKLFSKEKFTAFDAVIESKVDDLLKNGTLQQKNPLKAVLDFLTQHKTEVVPQELKKELANLLTIDKSEVLTPKFADKLADLMIKAKSEGKLTNSAIKDLIKDAVFVEAKANYAQELIKIAKENEDIQFKGVHSLARKLLTAESSTSQITEMEKVKEILGKLKYDLKRTPEDLKTQEGRSKFGEQMKNTVTTRLLPGWDFSRKAHYSGTELSTWVKFLGSGLSGFFLVSDAYNLVMEKTAGKDQSLARQKAQERAVQEVSRNLFSSYFVKFTNELFKPLYNLSLLGASAVTAGNVVGYEALTRKAVGIPVTRKSKEEILKSDSDNLAKTGFWGDYYKFMSYVTGKKALSSRVKPSELTKTAPVEQPKTSFDTNMYKAIKKVRS